MSTSVDPWRRRSAAPFLLWLILLGAVMAWVGSPAAARARPLSAAELATKQAGVLEGQININEASSDKLQLLPGVGPATADKILRYRERRPFRHPSHVMRIKGIGRKTFARLRPYIVVEGETTLHRAPG